MKINILLVSFLLFWISEAAYAMRNDPLIKNQQLKKAEQTDTLWRKFPLVESRYFALLKRINELPEKEMSAILNQYIDSIWYDGLLRWRTSKKETCRYDWFVWIARYQPRFYDNKTSSIDVGKRKLWQKEFAIMETEFLAFVNTKPLDEGIREKLWLQIQKLQGDLDIAKSTFQFTGRKLDLKQCQNSMVEMAAKMENTDFFLPFIRSMDLIITDAKSLGLTDEQDIRPFLKYLKSREIPKLSIWAEAKEQLLELKGIPFDFRFQTLDGYTYDISQMKGKVVLVDLWATWCSTCIAKMPMIKEIHEKYKDQGFEVLSISLNRKSEIPKVMDIEKRIGVHWPLCVIGDSPVKKKIMSRFGFSSVPQLILLDKNGKLIENNGKLFVRASFEEILKEALNE